MRFSHSSGAPVQLFYLEIDHVGLFFSLSAKGKHFVGLVSVPFVTSQMADSFSTTRSHEMLNLTVFQGVC